MNYDDVKGNVALRLALDEASKLRFRHQYTETLQRLRHEFGHSISMLAEGSERIARFNCFAYGLGLWELADYIRRVDAAENSAIVDSQLVRATLNDGALEEISAAEAAPGDVLLYFHKEAVTHAAVVGENQTCRSKWGGNEVHQHGLWEVPAQYTHTIGHAVRVSAFFLGISAHRLCDHLRRHHPVLEPDEYTLLKVSPCDRAGVRAGAVGNTRRAAWPRSEKGPRKRNGLNQKKSLSAGASRSADPIALHVSPR